MSASVPRPSERRFAAVSSSCGQARVARGALPAFPVRDEEDAHRPTRGILQRPRRLDEFHGPGHRGRFSLGDPGVPGCRERIEAGPLAAAAALRTPSCRGRFRRYPSRRRAAGPRGRLPATVPRSRMDRQGLPSRTPVPRDRSSRSSRGTRRNCASRAWRDPRPTRMSGPTGRARVLRRRRDPAGLRRQRRGPRRMRPCRLRRRAARSFSRRRGCRRSPCASQTAPPGARSSARWRRCRSCVRPPA